MNYFEFVNLPRLDDVYVIRTTTTLDQNAYDISARPVEIRLDSHRHVLLSMTASVRSMSELDSAGSVISFIGVCLAVCGILFNKTLIPFAISFLTETTTE